MLDATLYNTAEILALLQLEKTGPDRYLGQSHFMGSSNVFGGQIVGQALYAASATVENRCPHSLHALFILPGNYRLPIEYEVDRVRDGGAFSTRQIIASQEGRRICMVTASFQTREDGLSHQKVAPLCPSPESLRSTPEKWKELASAMQKPFPPVPIDFRIANEEVIYSGRETSPYKHAWVRAPLSLEDDPRMHQTLFSYISDYGLLLTALQPHGIVLGDRRLQIASLDHTIWFHRPFRMDEWLLFSMESPNASGGRGLCFAYVYNRAGELVATLAQEGLIRLHPSA